MNKRGRLSVFLMVTAALLANICLAQTCFGADSSAKEDGMTYAQFMKEAHDSFSKTGSSEAVKSSSRNMTEKEIIKGLKVKSDRWLRKNGYTDSQINQLRKLDPAGLTGKVRYSIGYRDFVSKKVRARHGSKKYWITYIVTVAKWKWINQPVSLFKDIFGVTTSAGFVKEAASCRAVYHLVGKRELPKKVIEPAVKTRNSGKGVFSRFYLGKERLPGIGYKWKCTDGVLKTLWIADGKINTAGLASNYGHSVLGINPSVSFGGGASISFKPAVSTKYLDEAYIRARK